MHYQTERNYGCRVSDAWSFRGLKTAVLENEVLRVVILVDKGADIYQLVHKPTDVDFLWRSPTGVRDPRRFLPTTGDPVGVWMDAYEGGWQTVFPAGGFPSNYRDADLGLHAEANLLPWDCAVLEDTPEHVSIKFWVRTSRMPFFFEKTLSLTAGSSVLEVDQAITNEAGEMMHCVWGEHIALGAPFLSKDCVLDLPGGTIVNHPVAFHPNNRLEADAKTPWPMTRGVDGSDIDMRKIPDKDVRAYDMSYFSDMPEGWYAVTNRRLGVGLGVRYPTDVYPYLWYWQSFGGGTGYPFWGRTYNAGLEPFSSYANEGLGSAIENGTAMELEPGESVKSALKVVAYTGSESVSRVAPDGSVDRA
jgi:hypothetical protein